MRLTPAQYIWAGTIEAPNTIHYLWSDPRNWQNNLTPANDNNADLVFPALPSGSNGYLSYNDLTGLTIHSITFSGSNDYVLDGNSIVLTSGGMTLDSTVTNAQESISDSFGITLGSSQVWTVATMQANLVVNGSVAGPPTANLTKTGLGILSFSGDTANNTYTGTTSVMQGTLELNAPAVPAISGPLIIGDSGSGQALVSIDTDNEIASMVAVQVNSSGVLRLSSSDSIGSLAGAGSVVLVSSTEGGSPRTALHMNGYQNASTIFSGVISGSGDLVKEGTGTLTLSGFNTFSGSTTVSAGTLLVNGSLTSDVMVSSGATLGGFGTMGPITADGTVSPGGPGTGILTSGDASFNTGSSFVVALNGTTPGSGYDQLNTSGDVDLSGSPTLTATAGFAASSGQMFTIITSSGGLFGTFSGLANNALLTVSGQVFKINYTSMSVVLTRVVAPTTTSLTPSAIPSVFGQAITFTATVTPSDSRFGSPTGIVQFQIDGTNFGSPVSLNNGLATSNPISSLSVSSGHQVTAIYSGDSNFSGSTGMVTHIVNQANTITTVTGSANPSVFTLPVTFTAVLAAVSPGGGTPTGTVIFKDGMATMAMANLDSTGKATFTTAALSLGSHFITAIYNGDVNFKGSTSSPLVHSVTSTPNEAFVAALYRKVLDRLPDVAGFNFWVQQLQAGATRTAVAFNFEVSLEYRGIEVDTFYETILNRAADDPGRAFWLNALVSGISEADVIVGFLTSAEFLAKFPLDASFVNQVFVAVLGHPADPASSALYVSALQQNLQTPAQVALAVLSSAETYGQAVDSYYSDLLDRAADPAGRQAFLTALQNGQFTPPQISTEFLASDEFFSKAAVLAAG
jgi:autotransporter-associated beta strand protein